MCSSIVLLFEHNRTINAHKQDGKKLLFPHSYNNNEHKHVLTKTNPCCSVMFNVQL